MADEKSNRDVHIGTDSTGAEYWLTPYSEKRIGNRKIVVRKSKKAVPAELQGMWSDATTAIRAFEQYMDSIRQKSRKKPIASTETATEK